MKIHSPAMKFKTEAAAKEWEEGLAKNADPYGNAVYRYASEFATLVESKVAGGTPLSSEVFKSSSHEADTEGITGFMYGAAVSMLSAWWLHGDQLRAWHNGEYLSPEEAAKATEAKATVNPAVMTVSIV